MKCIVMQVSIFEIYTCDSKIWKKLWHGLRETVKTPFAQTQERCVHILTWWMWAEAAEDGD